MTMQIPVYDEDMFDQAAVRNARAVDDAIRELAPVVKLARENITILGRFEHVSNGLRDWHTFSSTSRPWHDPNSVRPELLLTDDPPQHTRVRSVIAAALAPRALARMSQSFQADAAQLVDRLLDRAGETLDAVADITQPFVYKVLPDLLGLPQWGRENMSAFGDMVWATLGPPNELFEDAMANIDEVTRWVDQCCNRENLDAEGLGMQMFLAADRGEIKPDEAKLLIQILLSAAADTTVMTMGTAIRAFCLFPDQYRLLRAEPGLLRSTFDESLRWDSPSRMAGRITTREVRIEGYTIAAGERCGLLFAAANRDPRRWQDPDRFDIKRDHRGHLGWGFGVHACVGRILAQLEADALLGAIIKKIERFELAGEPEPWMTTIGHGPAKLPIRIVPAA